MNRRGFLGLLAASALATAATTTALGRTTAKLAPAIPILYGDGKHDDTESVQAVLDGKTVYRPDGSLHGPRDGWNVMPTGIFLVYERMHIRSNTCIDHCTFHLDIPPSARGSVLGDLWSADGYHDIRITNNIFKYPKKSKDDVFGFTVVPHHA